MVYSSAIFFRNINRLAVKIKELRTVKHAYSLRHSFYWPIFFPVVILQKQNTFIQFRYKLPSYSLISPLKTKFQLIFRSAARNKFNFFPLSVICFSWSQCNPSSSQTVNTLKILSLLRAINLFPIKYFSFISFKFEVNVQLQACLFFLLFFLLYLCDFLCLCFVLPCVRFLCS